MKQALTQLLQLQETVAVAESVTGGLVQSSFAAMENAMQFFQGGITVYNLGQKVQHLHIDPIYVASCNCVSERIAKEMALNVCPMFNSNIGLAITGYARPVPESGNRIFAYYAVARNGIVVAAKKITAEGDAVAVRQLYSDALIKAMADSLKAGI